MDMYTRAVLTVIAISLAAIALQNSGVLPAHAFEVPSRGLPGAVMMCGPDVLNKSWECARVIDGAVMVRTQ